MSLTLRQIRYFIATAEIGRISQAAIHLNISQSAVTAAIKELENLLGAELFERSSQGMTLTDSGRHFLNHAYSITRSVDDALKLPHTHEQAHGSLSLTASYTVQGYFLPYHLQRLSNWYPNIHIDLLEQERADIETSLLENRLDMGIVLTDNLTHPEIIAEPLFSSQRRLWLPSHHPLLERPSVKLADIASEPFIMLTVDEAAQSAMRYWEKSGHQPNVILYTSSVESVRSMVANGLGISLLSDLVYRPWSLEGRRIETLTLDDEVDPMNVGLAWRKERPFTSAMQAIRGYFKQAFLTPQQPQSKR
ncbi:MAG: HTH-type transcriptional regulator HdfR [Candidatus Celerinatantimonas neptuna]|nr:MAG: HTH-type transcriptional regulator HdfR [Candidatus Celerinatantimonas neptuna]